MNIKKIKTLFLLFYITSFIFILLSKPLIFLATNDDGIFVSILETEFNFFGQNNLIYPSIIYGSINKFLYNIFPFFQWHGLILVVLVGLSFLSLSFEIIKFKNNKNLQILILLIIYIQFVHFIFTPNFSSAALYIGLSACIIFYKNIILNFKLSNIIFIYFLISYTIRPDGFLFVLYIALPGVFYLIYRNLKFQKFNKLLDFRWLIIISAFMIDIIYRKYLMMTSPLWNEYYKFINLFHQVDTNPSFLKMHQNIAAFKIPGLNWSNVEATLLHQVAYLDPKVFNSQNLGMAVNSVHEYLGIRGMINADFLSTLIRIWEYLISVDFLLYACIFIFTVFLFKYKSSKIIIFFSSVYILFIFYYLGSVWRLPFRILLPIIFFIFIFLLILMLIHVVETFWLRFVFSISFILFTLFNLNQYGLKGQIQKSNIKIQEYADLNNTFKNLGESAVLIGQIKYLDENYTNAYFRNQDLNTIHVSSGWHNFSPYWYANLKQLRLNSNPLISLAKKDNLYWISDSYISEVLDMYMNDTNIYRKNKCEITKIGINNGSVYSFSKENTKCIK
jgi:hypothetical protein